MASRERILSIVLAAGAGTRFGGLKQLASLHGKPLLEHAVIAAAQTSTASTLVVLGAESEAIAASVDLGEAIVIGCRDWQHGPGASLRAGILAAGEDCTAVVVTLGDEPHISPAATERLIAARNPERPALRAAYRGRPGHPVLIERVLFPAFTHPSVPGEPRDVLRSAGLTLISCDDLAHPGDVDTLEQLRNLQGQTPKRVR